MNQIEKDIIEKYLELGIMKQVASSLNLRQNKVGAILFKYGLNKNNKIPKEIEKSEIDKQIIKLYEEGISEREIVKALQMSSRAPIQKCLMMYDIKKRTTKETSRLYYCKNETFFNNIDTEEKAYWFGFLFADGYILTSTDSIGLSLSEIDKKHIEKLNKTLNSTYPINTYNQTMNAISSKNKYCRLIINNSQMYNDLKNKGFTSNKTEDKRAMLYLIPDILKNHFIRGFFDGNGSVFEHTATNSASFSFDGNINIIKEIKEELIKNGVNSLFTIGKRFDTENCSYNIKTSGNKISLKFYDYIYNNATVFLDRKKLKFDTIFQKRFREHNKNISTR